MPNETKSTLVNLTEQEGEDISREIGDVLEKYSAQLVVSPIIAQNGTLSAKLEIFKKVELVPKEDIVSPIQDINGGQDTQTEKTA